MKITKHTNYIQIEGLEEHSQAYDKNSFLLKRLDSSSVLFLIEIVSPYEINLLFKEPVAEDTLIVTVNINGKPVSLLAQNKVEEPKVQEKPVEDTELEFHIDQDKNLFIVDNMEDIKATDLNIRIKSYCLERYADFPENVINLKITADKNGDLVKEIPFNAEVDRIYVITTKFKGTVKTINYIHGKPSCYYSSIYHIKNLASNFDLYINEMKFTEFDLKLLIWKYSKIAVGIAGITGDIIYDSKNSLLNDYVGQRALLDVITQAIREANLNPSIAKDTLGSIAVTLADLSHGAATTETVTTQLIRVHKELYGRVKDLEKNLKDYFAYLQAQDNLQNKSYKGKTVDRRNDFNPKTKRGKRY